MSGGSFNYLCDRDAEELASRTYELQEMTNWLRSEGYEREAAETERIIGRINKFHDEITARAKDLYKVWKAAEWVVSGDWGHHDMVAAINQHIANHPVDSYVPGLEVDAPSWAAQSWQVRMEMIEDARAKPEERLPRTEPMPKPESLKDDDYRWAEDADEWAANFAREELLWLVQAANTAIRTQDEAAAESKRRAAEDAMWDKRRAELIELFNGGPLNITNGQPIPTMALKAVEYIIEQERKAEGQS